MMKIAVIAKTTSENTEDLVQACRRLSVSCTIYQAVDIMLDSGAIANNDFFTHDVYIFRGYNKSYHQAQALAQYLNASGKIVIDSVLTGGFIPSKLHEALVYERNGIAHPRTYFLRRESEVSKLGVIFPVVVKDVDSQQGKGVRLCQSPEELRTEIRHHGDSIIIQEFIDMQYDVRVLIVGGDILGAIKRNVITGDFRSNVSLGSTVEKYILTEEEKMMALRAHAAMGYDISGVDIAHTNDGKPFVIETNITPEWQGFRRATGVDVAQAIIEYAKERCDYAE